MPAACYYTSAPRRLRRYTKHIPDAGPASHGGVVTLKRATVCYSCVALSHLQTSGQVTPILRDIRTKVAALVCRGTSLRLRWVPGHCGIPGNERADQLTAKALHHYPLSLTRAHFLTQHLDPSVARGELSRRHAMCGSSLPPHRPRVNRGGQSQPRSSLIATLPPVLTNQERLNVCCSDIQRLQKPTERYSTRTVNLIGRSTNSVEFLLWPRGSTRVRDKTYLCGAWPI